MGARRRTIRLTIALTLGALVLPAQPSFAQYAGPTPSETTPAAVGPTVLGKRVARQDSLPVTGGDIAGFAAIGLAAIGAGVGIRYRSRRPRRS